MEYNEIIHRIVWNFRIMPMNMRLRQKISHKYVRTRIRLWSGSGESSLSKSGAGNFLWYGSVIGYAQWSHSFSGTELWIGSVSTKK